MNEYPSIKPVEKSEPAPVETTPRQETTQFTSTEPTEQPLEVSPYIKDLWKLGEAAEHFEMPSLIEEINSFVLSEIARNHLESNQDSYKQIVEQYEKRLKLPEGIDVYTKTEKIAELMRIDAKLLKLAEEKEELLKKDITELTSQQLKRRIEGK